MVLAGVALVLGGVAVGLGPIAIICGVLLLWSGIVKIIVLRIWQSTLPPRLASDDTGFDDGTKTMLERSL